MEQRQLKFRAWDTQKKMFVDEGEICFCFYGDTRIEVHPNSIAYIGDHVHNGEPQGNRFHIQQYIGVDIHGGRSVYEGDILRHNEKLFVVRHSNNLFNFVLNEIIHPTNWRDLQWLDNVKKYIEVVGNIYETPELIHSAQEV